jgi:drug/metabolite transporter (DMT)-like permease
MDIALLIISMAACLFCAVIKKIYTRDSSGNLTYIHSFNAVAGIVSAIVLFLWGGFGECSLYTAILGAVFGVVTSLQYIFMMKALQLGPLSFTTVISAFSTVITALSGLFFGDSIGVFQIIGIVLMLASFIFAVEKKSDEKKGSFIWLVFCILCFIMTGGIGIMQKIHQESAHKSELNAFLVIAFAVSFIFSIILMLIAKKKEKAPIFEKTKSGSINWIFIVLMVISGICIAANNKLNLYLAGVLDSAFFFPMVNGGHLVLTTLTAVVFFREKLTFKQWIGVALGTLSVLFLCLS